MKIDTWPLAGLQVRTPRLELRYPDDEMLDDLVAVAAAGIHDRQFMPFFSPWTDRPPGELERGFLQYHWGRRAAWSVDSWDLDLAVVVDGRPVGMQGLYASQFPVLRQVASGSWLGRDHQGAGIGREMRSAILHLAFAGLGAEHARTEAFEDNPASLAVTRRLGYVADGEEWYVRRGTAARNLRFRMSRAQWERNRRSDIEIVGLRESLAIFGLDQVAPAD